MTLPADLFSPIVILAQDAPGLAGQPMSAPAPGTTAAPGTPVGQPAPATGMDSSFLFMMVAFVAVLIGTQIWAARKEKKKRDSLFGSLKRHDRVQTAGGVIGSIIEVKPETVVLKVDENSNTRITFARSSIVAVLAAGEGEKADAKA
jgi:preprotein translocase subunit YajC